jgi:lysozyme
MIELRDLPKLYALIKDHEGVHTEWYLDTEGFATIGVGHKATKFDDTTKGWTMDQVIAAFDTDVQKAMNGAGRIPVYAELDSVRSCALVDLVFNMGVEGVLKFKKMLKALAEKDFLEAAKQCLDSKYARQTKRRAKNIARMLQYGTW